MEKRELKRRPTYEYRCDERLKAKAEGSTRLAYNGLREGLEHLFFFIYYEKQVKRELKRIHISGYRCNERLKAKTDGSKRLVFIGSRRYRCSVDIKHNS